MKKIIGLLLILGSFACGYMGVEKINQNETSVEVLDVKVNVSKRPGKQHGYIYLGAGILLLAGGVYTLSRK